METFDFVVIGGGIVGLAIAKTFSDDMVGIVLEKEKIFFHLQAQETAR